MKALTIGGATLDMIIEYKNMETIQVQKENGSDSYLLLQEGGKIEVTKQNFFSGGGATNAAVALKKLEINTSFFGKIGKDTSGKSVLKDLKRYKVDTSLVKYSNTSGTATSYVVPSLKGDRTIFAYRGANAEILDLDLPLDAIEQADFIYVTSLSKQSASRLPLIVEHAKKCNTKVAVNPGKSQLALGNDYIIESIKNIDILILNYDEAKSLMFSFMRTDIKNETTQYTFESEENYQKILFSLRDFFCRILELTQGPRIVVITNGENGVYVGTKEMLYFHPALKVEKIVNTLGAGDAFGCSFSAAIYSGESTEKSILYGIINSSSVIQYHDSKSGLLNKKKLLSILKKTQLNVKKTKW